MEKKFNEMTAEQIRECLILTMEECDRLRNTVYSLVGRIDELLNEDQSTNVTNETTETVEEVTVVEKEVVEEVENLEVIEEVEDVTPDTSHITEEATVEKTSVEEPVEVGTSKDTTTEKTETTNPKPKMKKRKLRQALQPFWMDYEEPPKKKKSRKILLPYFCGMKDESVNHLLQLGNLKSKKEFSDPQETRVFDPSGISPCLTTRTVVKIMVDNRRIA